MGRRSTRDRGRPAATRCRRGGSRSRRRGRRTTLQTPPHRRDRNVKGRALDARWRDGSATLRGRAACGSRRATLVHVLPVESHGKAPVSVEQNARENVDVEGGWSGFAQRGATAGGRNRVARAEPARGRERRAGLGSSRSSTSSRIIATNSGAAPTVAARDEPQSQCRRPLGRQHVEVEDDLHVVGDEPDRRDDDRRVPSAASAVSASPTSGSSHGTVGGPLRLCQTSDHGWPGAHRSVTSRATSRSCAS